jgi:hypothetical protein
LIAYVNKHSPFSNINCCDYKLFRQILNEKVHMAIGHLYQYFLNFSFVYTKSETVNTVVCSPLIFHTFMHTDDPFALQHVIILCRTHTVCVINSSLDSWYLIYETPWAVFVKTSFCFFIALNLMLQTHKVNPSLLSITVTEYTLSW